MCFKSPSVETKRPDPSLLGGARDKDNLTDNLDPWVWAAGLDDMAAWPAHLLMGFCIHILGSPHPSQKTHGLCKNPSPAVTDCQSSPYVYQTSGHAFYYSTFSSAHASRVEPLSSHSSGGQRHRRGCRGEVVCEHLRVCTSNVFRSQTPCAREAVVTLSCTCRAVEKKKPAETEGETVHSALTGTMRLELALSRWNRCHWRHLTATCVFVLRVHRH